MKTYQFKTNINCSKCIEKVTPFLNEEFSVIEWSVDTSLADKLLKIQVEDDLSVVGILDLLETAGFNASFVQTLDN